MPATSYTLDATTPLPFADAVERVRTELKTEGFGVLCDIDVQATLHDEARHRSRAVSDTRDVLPAPRPPGAPGRARAGGAPAL